MRQGTVLTGKLLKDNTTIDNRCDKLQRVLLTCSLFNLFLTSCLGILLRTFPFISSFPLAYKNILHGHSHFAFGGWVMPVLLVLIMKSFPELTKKIAYRHWRNIALLMLASAYGMLISFPLQGYKFVSITFSTVSLVAGYYLAVVIWRNTRNQLSSIAHKFLSAGLFYHVLSSAGPFATAPLIVMGKAGTPLYFDVIYFFLHFQYNGFFTFVILAIIYKYLEAQNAGIKSGNLVFLLFNSACIPAYFLSILWHQPSLIFNVVGGVAAGLQVFALIFLIKDAVQIRWMHNYVRTLFALSLFAFTLKNIFQFMGAFPLIASISYEYRNLVIAYLHLVLLGFVSLFSFSAVLEFFTIRIADPIRWGVFLFLAAFVTTELLLAFSAAGNLWGFKIRAFSMNLLLFSCLFPVAFIILYTSIKKQISGFPSPFTNHPNPLNPPPKTLSP